MSGDRFLKILFVGLGAVLLVLAIALMVSDDEKCQKRGGVLVRGLIGYECVRKP